MAEVVMSKGSNDTFSATVSDRIVSMKEKINKEICSMEENICQNIEACKFDIKTEILKESTQILEVTSDAYKKFNESNTARLEHDKTTLEFMKNVCRLLNDLKRERDTLVYRLYVSWLITGISLVYILLSNLG